MDAVDLFNDGAQVVHGLGVLGAEVVVAELPQRLCLGLGRSLGVGFDFVVPPFGDLDTVSLDDAFPSCCL